MVLVLIGSKLITNSNVDVVVVVVVVVVLQFISGLCPHNNPGLASQHGPTVL